MLHALLMLLLTSFARVGNFRGREKEDFFTPGQRANASLPHSLSSLSLSPLLLPFSLSLSSSPPPPLLPPQGLRVICQVTEIMPVITEKLVAGRAQANRGAGRPERVRSGQSWAHAVILIFY